MASNSSTAASGSTVPKGLYSTLSAPCIAGRLNESAAGKSHLPPDAARMAGGLEHCGGQEADRFHPVEVRHHHIHDGGLEGLPFQCGQAVMRSSAVKAGTPSITGIRTMGSVAPNAVV